MNSQMLNVSERAVEDNYIVSIADHSHPPYNNTSLNNSDEIRIPIQTQDSYTFPHQSSINITGKLLDDKDAVTATATFISNGFLHLFEEIRYEVAGIIVDRVRNPGYATTIKAYVSFNPLNAVGYENAGWNHNQNPKVLDAEGNFNVCIPMRMVMGFFEDFKKILINVRQELVLLRCSADVNAIISTKVDEKIKVEIHKIYWRMPHVQVSDEAKLRLISVVDRGVNLHMSFRSWELHEYPVLQETVSHTWNVKTTNQLEKPRFIIIGFQTDKKNKITSNASKFDHCNLTNLKAYLNSSIYPYDNFNLNFDKGQWSALYNLFVRFQESFYQKESAEPCLNPESFKDSAPLCVIDCSHQNETLKTGVVDIRLEFECSKNMPSNTSAYCLIIHERAVKYNPLRNTVEIA